MELSDTLRKAYGRDGLSAREAQLRAQFIAWGPMAFQAARIMLKRGISWRRYGIDSNMSRQLLL